MTEHRVQDFPHWRRAAIHRTLGDLDGAKEPVAGVADEHDEAFLPGAVKKWASRSNDVGRASELFGLVCADPPAQMEGGDEGRG